jgi:hypothetical protein
MIIAEHCKLCDNKIVDFKTGVICSLTNKKPDFTNKCPKIVLENDFEKQITKINIEYESVLNSRTNQIGLGVFNLIISLVIFILGMVITNFIFQKGFISTITLVILVIACIPLAKGIGTINSYFNDLKIAKKQKQKLDKIASFYGYDYNIQIQHIKDSLGNIEHKADLKIFKIPIKVLNKV